MGINCYHDTTTMDYEPPEPPTAEEIAAGHERHEQEKDEEWEIECAAKEPPEPPEWEAEMMLWTTASSSYDGFGTVETGRKTSWRGREYREVRVLEKYHDWQKSRYLSGCHDCLTTADLEMLTTPA